MFRRPGFAIGALVLAHHDNGDVRIPRHLGRRRDAFQLELGAGEFDLVLVPRRPALLAFRDPAALRVNHLGSRARARADAIQDADAAPRIPAVTAYVNIRRVGTDHRNGLVLRQVQRQQVAVVLEQHNGFLGGLHRQLTMLGAVGDALGVVGVHIGVLEQPQTELHAQYPHHRAVDLPLRHFALLHLLQQRAVNLSVAQVVVHARRQRLPRRAREIRCDVVSRHQHLQSAAVGHHIPAESPFLAQHLIQQP